MSGDARIREAFLDARVVAESGTCPTPEVLWHAASGNLRRAAMSEVLDHIALCGPCTEDFRIVREVVRGVPATAASGLLRRIAASMVAPVPALAYLALACLCLALLARELAAPPRALGPVASGPQSPAAPESPALAAVISELRLTGDVATRGEAAGAGSVTVAPDRVLLRLYVDETPAELDRLLVRVSSGAATLWEEEQPVRMLAPDGSLPLLLDLSSRRPGEIVTVTIDLLVPGGRDERLFEQTLRVEAR